MLQSVLWDESVGDYNSYIKSLVNDLRSAMLQAQRSSTREQKHQSDQYNKRAKGLPLAVGDQVLVANRGSMGKQKLADRWEPVVYIVVASKPALHLYCIRDQIGNERVVHRNLALEVNLPGNVALDDDAAHPARSLADVRSEPDVPVLSVTDVDAASTCPSLTESSVSFSSDISAAHTSAWVQQLPPAVSGCDAELHSPTLGGSLMSVSYSLPLLNHALSTLLLSLWNHLGVVAALHGLVESLDHFLV